MNLMLSSLAVAALAALAQAAYPISGTTVNCRAGPTTDSAIVRTYHKDDEVAVACQTRGPDVNGNTIWDKTADGCYVSDYFVKTGTSKYVADECAGHTTSLGSNSTVVPTASATSTWTSTRGPAVSTTPVPARAAPGLDTALAAYLALPLVLLGLA